MVEVRDRAAESRLSKHCWCMMYAGLKMILWNVKSECEVASASRNRDSKSPASSPGVCARAYFDLT
jgi:hypothetical protein